MTTVSLRRVISWWDSHQVALYLLAIAVGGIIGLVTPGVAPVLETATNPVLALLLFATFLGVPIIELGRAFRDVRFYCKCWYDPEVQESNRLAELRKLQEPDTQSGE